MEKRKAKAKAKRQTGKVRTGCSARSRTRDEDRPVGARHASPSPVRRKPPRVPPPESDVWPEEYRGAKWRPAYAFLFAGKCLLCAHSCPLPRSRQLMDRFQGNTRLLHCTNHPGYRGQIVEVLPTDTCRNFKAKCWTLRVDKAKERPRCPTPRIRGRKVERIPLGDNLFALVDAADFKGEIGQHNWYVTYRGSNVYATCFVKRKAVYMHRMVARPRRGYIVDHKDGNGLNNCRDNLRVCTRRQNQANRRSRHGGSRFTGVYPHKDKWIAEITSHGRYFYLGIFDDEVKAAKARDRKAWELHGEFAYLNFPEDYAHKRRRKTTPARGTRPTRRRRPR